MYRSPSHSGRLPLAPGCSVITSSGAGLQTLAMDCSEATGMEKPYPAQTKEQFPLEKSLQEKRLVSM